MTSGQERRFIRRLYWTSFALRFGIAMLAWVATEFFKIPFLEDAIYYSDVAAATAQAWLSGTQATWLLHAMEGGRQPWFMVGALAVLYTLMGGIKVLPLALGLYCLLTSITPLLAYRAARRLGIPMDGARYTARLVAYSPVFAFWSAALYKEGVILILLFLIIDHAVRLQESLRPVSLLVLGACLLGLFGLRFYIAAILSVTLLVALTFGRNRRGSVSASPPVLRQVFVLFLLVFLFSLLGVSERTDKLMSVSVEANLEQMNSSRQDLAGSRSGYLQHADVSTPDKAARFLPVGLAYFLTVPLPWQIGSFRQNLAIPETLFWIVIIYPRIVRGIRRGIRSNPQGTLFLLLSLVAITCLYALFIGNIGTAYRVRVQVWAFGALFAGWGLPLRARRLRRAFVRQRTARQSRLQRLEGGVLGPLPPAPAPSG